MFMEVFSFRKAQIKKIKEIKQMFIADTSAM